MARADNFRMRQQQLYENPFIGGGVAWQQFFTFSPNCTFSGFLSASSQRLKLQASNLVVIDQVSTNQKTEIYP